MFAKACACVLLLVACQRSAAPSGPHADSAASNAGAAPPAPQVAPPAAATPVALAEAAAPQAETACGRHLAEARAELLRRGFSPTRDTGKWLRLIEEADGSTKLSLVMRTSADGASTRYLAQLIPGAFRASPWRGGQRRYCCDEHANEEDKLVELAWKRHSRVAQATLSIVYFSEDKSAEALRDRALFEQLAKQALERCLT
jgi:hypothetical protein